VSLGARLYELLAEGTRLRSLAVSNGDGDIVRLRREHRAWMSRCTPLCLTTWFAPSRREIGELSMT